MTYTLHHSDGTFFGNILVGQADGINNTAPGNPTYPLTNLTLFGENFSGYGLPMNENFVKLLENFASTTSPTRPITGQLWWDKTNHLLKSFNGTVWAAINGAISLASAPTNPITGEFWWDTTSQELKIWNGASWSVIGGGGNANVTSAAETITVLDTLTHPHLVTTISINGTVASVLSNDPQFLTTDPQISGFGTIGPGFNILSGSFYNGLAILNATNLNGGTTGSLPYQSAGNTTAMLGIGINDQVLTVSGGLPTWQTPAPATQASVFAYAAAHG
jgi:hypothetical protein